MEIDDREKAILEGERGRGMQRAMEILKAYGESNNAERMVPITSVHIAANFPVMMDEGIDWLEDLAKEGARVKVFTTKNPEMYDFEMADELRIPTVYQARQERIHQVINSLGVSPTYTCQHYLVGNVPRFGDHIAWASSGSQCFANSVIGARSNRDGDHGALAAAIIGSVPEWGMHLKENRKGEILIDVGKLELENYDPADYKALGWSLGKTVGSRIPVFINLPVDLHIECIKGILYTLTVTGAPGLIHLVGITPEAPSLEAAFFGSPPPRAELVPVQEEVDQAYREISTSTEEKVDMVIFGCPQCSIQEINEVGDLLADRKLHHDTRLWICTSRWVKTLCQRSGLLERIEATGARIISDVGAADGPHIYLKEQGVRVIAINSARGSYYAGNLCGMDTWFGSTLECIESAISGKWEGRK